MLAIIATPPSMAKTKVFGELHTSVDKVFPVGESSRIDWTVKNAIVGIKGSTEIKKDISFIYQLSWGIDSSGFESQGVGHNGLTNRNQVIGIASRAGAVIIGRFDTPFKTLGRKADLFWHSQLGQNRNVTNASDWDVRADKIIVFQSPKIKGFQGSLAYVSDISDTSNITENASAISASGFYKKGKFVLGAAFEQHNLEGSNANTQALRFSTIYRHKPLKLVGFYQKENNDTAITGEADADVFGVGIAYRKGKGTYKAQFYKRNTDSTADNSDLITLGYDHKLAKKLDAYAQIAQGSNLTSFGENDFAGTNASNNNDAHGFSFGLRYKF